MRIFQNCAQPVVINGQRERIVMEQILNALKAFTDRMSAKSSGKLSVDESIQNDQSEATFDKTNKSS